MAPEKKTGKRERNYGRSGLYLCESLVINNTSRSKAPRQKGGGGVANSTDFDEHYLSVTRKNQGFHVGSLRECIQVYTHIHYPLICHSNSRYISKMVLFFLFGVGGPYTSVTSLLPSLIRSVRRHRAVGRYDVYAINATGPGCEGKLKRAVAYSRHPRR